MASVLCRPAWLVCEGILFAALAGCGAGTETDLYYTRAVYNFARDVSGARRAPVYRYLFTHRYENPAPQDTFVTDARAFHGAETYFVTGSLQSLGTSMTYSPSSAELALSEAMMGYW